MFPFDYPDRPHVRKHGPRGYVTVESYRPWLRDEFVFRCVYCLRREVWSLKKGAFVVEHFEPQAHRPHRRLDYDNLLYSCQSCNLAKSDQNIPDPLKVLTADNVLMRADGSIEGRTKLAKTLVRKLGLDDPIYREYRRLIIDIIALSKAHDSSLFNRLTQLPPDLPNLAALKPPGGNSQPDGLKGSFFNLLKQSLPP